MFDVGQNVCSVYCWVQKFDKQMVTELQYKVMYYMQIIKDLILGLKEKNPTPMAYYPMKF